MNPTGLPPNNHGTAPLSGGPDGREILEVYEREQQRISAELHDDLGQRLAGMWFLTQAQPSGGQGGSSAEADHLLKMAALLKDALALTHSLARRLNPGCPNLGGLARALQELAQVTALGSGITCRFRCVAAPVLDRHTGTHLYRIAQEAVAGAVRHGLARELDIELSSGRTHTLLSVTDHGTGLDAACAEKTAPGWRMMNFRAGMLGGVLAAGSLCPGPGAFVTCRVPVLGGDSVPSS